MAPPPSQKGKFKPRKPAKKANKVAIGSTVGATPHSVPTPAEPAAATPTAAAAPTRGSASRKAPPRGRGPRPPAPQGQVFFTGNSKPAAPSVGKKRAATSAGSKKKADEAISATGSGSGKATGKKSFAAINVDEDTNEEVIGTLERSIGSLDDGGGTKKKSSSTTATTTAKKKDALESMDMMDFEEDSGPSSRRSTSGHGMDSYYYDSDSSSDDERNNGGSRRTLSELSPTVLPFKAQSAPIGVGGTDQPTMYPTFEAQKESHPNEVLDQMDLRDTESYASPFVDGSSEKDLDWEKDSWFLFQLPTRLPALQQSSKRRSNSTVKPQEVVSSNDDITVTNSSGIAEVVTNPVAEDSFDNTLKTTAPGRIGKVVVYKSGKTVLVMEGSDPSRKVRLDMIVVIIISTCIRMVLLGGRRLICRHCQIG